MFRNVIDISSHPLGMGFTNSNTFSLRFILTSLTMDKIVIGD